MCVDYSIHLGPYVECKVGKKKIDILETQEAVKERLFHPLGYELSDQMKKEKLHWFFGNVDWGNKRKDDFYVKYESSFMNEITSYLIAEECVKFELFFKTELDYLRKIYGECNVQIKWGLFNQIW